MKRRTILVLKAVLLSVVVVLKCAKNKTIAQNLVTDQNNKLVTYDTAPYNIKLSDALKSFKHRFGVDILFVDKVVEGIVVPADLFNSKEPAEAILSNLLSSVGLKYKKIRNNLYAVVGNKKASKSRAPLSKEVSEAEQKKTENLSLENIKIIEKKSVGDVPAIEIMTVDIVITGTVKDEKGDVMQGVTVKEKGTNNIAITNEKGVFKIKVKDEKAILEFSSLNYVAQGALINKNKKLEVVLKQDEAKKLEDVVVVGYGTVKKGDVTGAVSTIRAKDLQGAQINTVQDALQGRVAGLQMTSGNAAPGESATIRIRGVGSLGTSSDPLYVIDGYPSNEDITSINPNDIETIDVLKDASATAIYGARGANGVIIITTKKGSKNGKLTIDVDVYHGVASISHKLDLMNASEYAEYRNRVQSYTNPSGKPFASANLLDYYSKHNTDWQDALFKIAPVTSANISISGGDLKTRYLISGSYFDQQGIVQNTGFSRAAFRFNFDREITNKLKFNITTSVTKTLNSRTLINTAGGTAGGVVLGILRMNPVTPVYDSLGNYTVSNISIKDPLSDSLATVDPVGNPLAFAKKSIDENNSLRAQINTSLEYEISKNIKFKAVLGGQYISGWRNVFYPNDLYEQRFANGTAQKTNSLSTNWLNEDYLTYNKNFNPQFSLNMLLGMSFQVSQSQSSTAQATNFFTNTFGYNNLSIAGSQLTFSDGSKNQLQSFFSRINAKLFNNLLFTGTIRADGASKFGANHKYGFFPSTAVAYKLNELAFIKKLKVLNDFKLRLGYGITGNQEIAPYLSLYGFANAQNTAIGTNNSAGRTTFGTTSQAAIAGNRPENSNLQWEQTESINTGLDLSFFHNRLNITADYYVRTTKKLLWAVPVPATTGFTSVFQNLGKIENRGFELAILSKPLVKRNFSWSNTLTFAINRNKVLSIGKDPYSTYGAQLGIQGGTLLTLDPNFIYIKPGLPIGNFYGNVADGIWQSQAEIDRSSLSGTYKTTLKPGGVLYRDLNGDGTIDANDQQVIGNANPKFTLGFFNTFSYKNVELTIFLQGQQGNMVLNFNKYNTEIYSQSNKASYIKNSWSGEGSSNTLPRPGMEQTRLLDNTFVEDGSYIRVKTVTLGYNLQENSYLIQRAKIKSLKVYATVTNLLTFTKYTGYDSEVGSYNNNLFAQGIDYGAYPVSKSVILGVKIGL